MSNHIVGSDKSTESTRRVLGKVSVACGKNECRSFRLLEESGRSVSPSPGESKVEELENRVARSVLRGSQIANLTRGHTPEISYLLMVE